MSRRRARRRRRPFFVFLRAPWVLGGLLLAALLIGKVSFGRVDPAAPSFTPGLLHGQTIYIDPGHGGIDPGACGESILEKDIVLEVALYLGIKLEQGGAKVVYSRTGDYDLGDSDADDVRARVDLIKSSGADIVISVHANYFSDPGEYGAQTFYDSKMNPKSKILAEAIQAAFTKDTDTTREASDRLDHFILRRSEVPAVTVEVGFVTNPGEEALLGSPKYQQKLASCIYDGIIQFLTPETSP